MPIVVPMILGTERWSGVLQDSGGRTDARGEGPKQKETHSKGRCTERGGGRGRYMGVSALRPRRQITSSDA